MFRILGHYTEKNKDRELASDLQVLRVKFNFLHLQTVTSWNPWKTGLEAEEQNCYVYRHRQEARLPEFLFCFVLNKLALNQYQTGFKQKN